MGDENNYLGFEGRGNSNSQQRWKLKVMKQSSRHVTKLMASTAIIQALIHSRDEW
jgi:hypothetical protein